MPFAKVPFAMTTTAAAQSPPVEISIIQELSSLEPERALEKAFAQLHRGGSLPLLVAMLKALVRVGLGGIAVRLLQSAGGPLRDQPEIILLAQQLSRLPSGEIPQATLKARLTHNWQRLRTVQPHLEPFAQQFQNALQQFACFASRGGNFHVLRNEHGRKLDMVFPFIDQHSHAQSMSIPEPTLNMAIRMIGVPSVALFKRLLELRTPEGYMPPIDVIEPDVDVLGVWLGLIDDPEVFESERVAIFTGSDALAEYRRFLIERPCRAVPTAILTNARANWQPPVLDGRVSQELVAMREQRNSALAAKVKNRFAGRDAKWWRNRYAEAAAGGRPLRVLGFTTRYSTVIRYALSDLGRAFARRGCQFKLVMHPDSHSNSVDLHGALAQDDFDLIVVINHLRCEYAGVIPAHAPYVCWMQDHMDQFCSRDAAETVNELDLIISHAPHVMADLYGYPIDRFLASNNLTDPDTYSNAPLPEDELAPHRCDVSFVSHGAGTPEQLIDEISHTAPLAFKRYLQRFLELVQASLKDSGWITSQGLLPLLLQAEAESGHPRLDPHIRRAHVFPQLMRLYDRIFRHQALEWTARWAKSCNRSFRIYGRGWERHPTLNSFAAGEIEAGRPLRAVFQASAVSLQLNGYASLHQRMLDSLAAGGFVLARYNPADFIRQPYAYVQSVIQNRKLKSLNELLELAEVDAHVRSAIDDIERLSGAVLAPSGDPRREAFNRVQREANPVLSVVSDEGLFNMLARMELIPARTAGDIDGFEKIVFRNEAELHAMLDHYVDDPEARFVVASAMRDSVIKHDTYDTLVEKILSAFRTGVVES